MSTAMNMSFGSLVLTGVGALSLDLGFMNMATLQVQAAADSAAIGAAISVMEGESDAGILAAAQTWGHSNRVGSSAVIVDDGDVRRGAWDEVARKFTADAYGDDIWVRARTAEVPSFLSRLWGIDRLDTAAIAIARVPPPFICTLVGTDDSVVHGHPAVAGYDSTENLLPPVAFDSAAAVCSNTSITVGGTSHVDGNVRPGRGGEVIGGGTVTGSTDELCAALVYDAPIFPGALKSWPLPASSNGTTATALPPGKYRINRELRINGQATISISGPTEIYVDTADVTINGGGFVNTTNDPHNLKIFVRDVNGAKTVRINGNAAFYGFVYAPDSRVVVTGTAAFHGAIVSTDLDLGGTGAVYMDTSLMPDEQQCGVRLVK